MVLSLAFAVSQAAAVDQIYVETGNFATGPGAGDEELTHPRRTAVNQANGDLYIADRDNDRIVVYRPGTDPVATYLTQFGAGAIDAPFGVAIDAATGDVYVSSQGTDEIVKFNSDGAATPTFTVDPAFTSPSLGAGATQIGDFEADLAFDSSTDDLLVADPGNNLVKRFEVDGTHLANFDGSSSPDGVFTELLDLDVAPNGDIYVVDAQGPQIEEGVPEGETGSCVQNAYCGTGKGSRALRFDSNGANGKTLVPFQTAALGLIAFDASNSQLLVADINPQGANVSAYRIDGTGPVGRFGADFTAMASLATYNGPSPRAYLGTDIVHHNNFNYDIGAVKIKAFRPVNKPTFDGDVVVSAVTSSSAHLSASVNPNGVETTGWFEYTRDGNWQKLPGQQLGNGTSPVTIENDLSGLVPNVEYQVRITVKSVAGAQETSTETAFTTGIAGPFATTLGAAPRTENSARLNGWVNPQNLETTYLFEYGPSQSYGNAVPLAPSTLESGEAPIAVSAELEGLAPGATFHFRLVATNAAGTTEGVDRTFTTRTPSESGPPKRGVELVNNPEKGNQTAQVTLGGPIASPDASKIIWTTRAGAPGGSTGTATSFLAERTPEGWRSKSFLPPLSQLVGNGEQSYSPKLANPDFTKFGFEVSEGILTSAPWTFVAMDLDYNQDILGRIAATGQGNAMRANDDFSHVYVNSRDPDGSIQLYDLASNPPERVTVMPDGSVPACGTPATGTPTDWLGPAAYEWVTTDPQAPARIWFTTGQPPCNEGVVTGKPLYMRDLSTQTTTLLSGPSVSDTPQEEGGMFGRASDDGSEVIFTATASLTAEDQNNVGDIYRYSNQNGKECLTCVGPGGNVPVEQSIVRHLTISNDLSHVYFSSTNILVPGEGQQGANNLYVWHDGRIDFIAPLGSSALGPLSFEEKAAEIVGEGKVLFFSSDDSQVTTDNTGGYRQYYRYSEEDHSIECVTCAPDKAPAAPIGPLTGDQSNDARLRASAEGGSSFVFSTADSLSPRDINGTLDIYEWRNGAIGLVTDGVTEHIFGGLRLLGIGNDGLNIVFLANKSLTGYERDAAGQFYVARAGGGFPPPAAPPAPCGEESCQGPLQAPVPVAVPGSSSYRGSGNVREQPKQARKRCAKGRKHKSMGSKRCIKKRTHNDKRRGK